MKIYIIKVKCIEGVLTLKQPGVLLDSLKDLL